MNLQDTCQPGTAIERETWEMNTAQVSLPQLHTHTSSAFLGLFYVTLSLPKQWWTLLKFIIRAYWLLQQFCSLCFCFILFCFFSPKCWFRIAWRQERQRRKTSSPSFSSAQISPTCFLVWLWCPEEGLAEVWSHQVLIWGIVSLYSIEATSFFTHSFIQQAFGKHLLCQEWV